jgi:hypothetical protein
MVVYIDKVSHITKASHANRHLFPSHILTVLSSDVEKQCNCCQMCEAMCMCRIHKKAFCVDGVVLDSNWKLTYSQGDITLQLTLLYVIFAKTINAFTYHIICNDQYLTHSNHVTDNVQTINHLIKKSDTLLQMNRDSCGTCSWLC